MARIHIRTVVVPHRTRRQDLWTNLVACPNFSRLLRINDPRVATAPRPAPAQPRNSIGMPVESMNTASVRRLQRSHGAFGIAYVARLDLAQKGGKCNAQALFFQLLIAPSRSFIGTGGKEHLESRRPGRSPCPCHGRRPPAPGPLRKLRCLSSRAARTDGIAAIAEAAAPQVSVRISSVASGR